MDTIFMNSENSKTCDPTWNKEFELLDESCSV